MQRAVAAGVLLCLAGCASSSVKINPPSVQTLQDLTAADLQQAIVFANAAVPPDAEAATCYTFLLTNLDKLTPISQPAGVVSAFELGRLGYQKLSALSPIGNVPLETACGPFSINVIGGVYGLLQQLGVRVALSIK